MQHIWYVAYGSNLSRERFCYYLRGGRPDGSERDYPGCRDCSDPSDSFGSADQRRRLLRRPLLGLASWDGVLRSWRPRVRWRRRAYLITAEQFVDVLAQETRRSPGMSSRPGAQLPR